MRTDAASRDRAGSRVAVGRPRSSERAEATTPRRRGSKRAAAMEAARTLFVERGYEGVSMMEIAHEAGISRATIYAHHRSKAELFHEVALEAIRRTTATIVPPSASDPPARALRRFLARYVEASCWAGSIELQRTVLGAHTRFPDLGPTIVEGVIERATGLLAAYLRDLDIPDPHTQASALLEAATGPRHTRTLLGETKPLPEPPRVSKLQPGADGPDIEAAVAWFLAARPAR